jgi:hypothetical protein
MRTGWRRRTSNIGRNENDRRMMRFAMARLKDLATAVDAFD